MVGQREYWHWSSFGAILRIGNGFTINKIGPSIPGPLTYLEEQIRHIPHRAASTVISTLVNCKKSTIGQEAQAISITQSPADQLLTAPIGIAAHDGSRAGQLRGDALPRIGTFTEWNKRACACSRPGFMAERVWSFEVDAC